MSGLLVNYPTKPHTLADDLESFVHLINWLTIRYHKECKTLQDLQDLKILVSQVYEQVARTPDGYDVGSKRKLRNMQKGEIGYDSEGLPRALSDLVTGLAEMCKEHLSSIDYEANVYPYAVQVQETTVPPIIERPVKAIPKRLRESFLEGEGVQPLSQPRTKPEAIKLKGKAVMNNHDTIYLLLCQALRTSDESWGGSNVKLDDQFAKLGSISLDCLTLAGGSSASTASSSNVTVTGDSYGNKRGSESQVTEEGKEGGAGGSKPKRLRSAVDIPLTMGLRSRGGAPS